uniref:SecY-independent transporter protein n=1 Tax=Selaginella moellendorffii TaxID=88036 RepID=F2YIA6_SELML|nr:SecY-independent transporter protein [Selaginella moellendorffii]AEA29874.1 SecY-independent transporter protein [Selaginella moellendorffii]
MGLFAIMKPGAWRMRFFWMLTCAIFCGCTVYWFGEEFLFLLAKPFFTLPEEPLLISTLSTEALRTHVIMALILCLIPSFFVLLYQSWCFLMPTIDEDGREYLTEVAMVIGFGFLVSITLGWLALKVWEFLYFANITSTNLLITNFQPMIFAYLRSTVSLLCTLTLVGQIPGIMLTVPLCFASPFTIWLVRIRFPAPIPGAISALACPPQIGCLLVAAGLIYLLIELTFFIGVIRAVVTSTRTQTPESFCSGSHHGDCWACRL